VSPASSAGANVWFHRALGRWNPEREAGFAGFESRLRRQPEGSVGLLRGAAGTALCLLDAMSTDDLGWDRVILTSS